MQKIIDKCDKVIIPEDGPDQGNITRVGPIVRKINSTREELRKKYSFTKKTIIVSAGGTATGLFLFEKMLDLAPKLNKDIDVVFVTGPNIQKKIDRIRNLGFIDNLHEAIFAADLVVSLAGKSTIDEARAYGTPGIFIPLKAHFEQEDNARDEGFVFEDLERLHELICNKLDQKRNPVESLGAQKASQIITELIESKSNP
jgi:UDP-N-acetylglucosamine--N-acetylmuramyl-(pentapeptide) pyrophosphoryl-undecaprenol N-acetylglucosamine transferase